MKRKEKSLADQHLQFFVPVPYVQLLIHTICVSLISVLWSIALWRGERPNSQLRAGVRNMPNWKDVLHDINQTRTNLAAQANASANAANTAQDIVRRKYLDLLQKKTQRNVISYYSGFLSKPENLALDINDEDKNGFMTAVHQLDKTRGLDLILHTPGGRIDATQSIVNYLHKMFKGDIRAIVPQIAMSGGTMIACSYHTILTGTHSNLGRLTRGYGVSQLMAFLKNSNGRFVR